MAQGQSTKIISMIKWIVTSRLSIKKSLSLHIARALWHLRRDGTLWNCAGRFKIQCAGSLVQVSDFGNKGLGFRVQGLVGVHNPGTGLLGGTKRVLS